MQSRRAGGLCRANPFSVTIVDFIVTFIYFRHNTFANINVHSVLEILSMGQSRACTRKVVGTRDLEYIPSPLVWSALLFALQRALEA